MNETTLIKRETRLGTFELVTAGDNLRVSLGALILTADIREVDGVTQIGGYLAGGGVWVRLSAPEAVIVRAERDRSDRIYAALGAYRELADRGEAARDRLDFAAAPPESALDVARRAIAAARRDLRS